MQILRIQSTNQTTFGTRFGENLTRFIEKNKYVLSSENYQNLSKIRNNGIDSVLELEEASAHDKKMFNYKYVLTLRSAIMDKKNEVMKWGDSLCRCFQDYINGNISGKVIATNDRFPVPINDLKENTYAYILLKFNNKFGLPEKIEKEAEQSQIIVNEFEKFEEKWNNTITSKK